MRLLLLFGLSGAAGLIYQVVWVRELGIYFGSSVQAAALVTALFMLGLGVGSRVAGNWADRWFADRPAWPLRAYAASELSIAGLALLAALVLPRLAPSFNQWAEYVVGPDGWRRLSTSAALGRYLIGTVLLLPITFLMGGTLTLLIRHRVRELGAHAGREIAALYGINTLGAALGCLLTDLWLVPNVGLFGTQLVAVGTNVLAGLGALWLPAPAASRVDDHPPAEAGAAPRSLWIMGAVLATTGFISMGLEILWFRHLSSLLGSRRIVFSVLLALILLSLWLGTRLASRLLARGLTPAVAYAGLQAIFVVATVAGLYGIGGADLVQAEAELRGQVAVADSWTWWLLGLELTLTPMLLMVVLPSIAMGASFPLANAAAQRSLALVGRRAGTLYLFNSVGGAAGSLAVGLLLLPVLGLQRSALLLLLGSCVSAAVLLATASGPEDPRAPLPPKIWVSTLGPAAVACLLFGTLPADSLWRRTIPQRAAEERVLAAQEGVNETIVISESTDGARRLITNGYSMSGTKFSGQRYMRLFAHLPLLTHKGPERGLVICFGVGNTLHAASLHGLRELDLVDLSEDILKLAGHFSATHHGVIDDPSVRVFVNDGRQHLRMLGDAHYDFITAEPPPLRNAGVAALYSVEFYQEVKRALRPGGWFTHWLPIYQLTEPMARSAVATFLEVFPGAVLLSGDREELILVAVKDGPVQLDLSRVEANLAARPSVVQDLVGIEASQLVELVGTFAGGPNTLRGATQGAPLITDDRPIMEYETASFAPRRRIPPELFSAVELPSFCPACADTAGTPLLPELGGYLKVMNAVYSSDDFLERIAPPDPDLRAQRRPFRLEVDPPVEAAIQRSPYLQRLTGRRPVTSPSP